MATIQTQRDATVILTDSSNWIPWYRQLKLKCQSQGIWPLLDPEGVRLQRIQPEARYPRHFAAATRAETLEVAEAMQTQAVIDDFLGSVSKMASTWTAGFQGPGYDKKAMNRKRMMKLFREYMSLHYPSRGKPKSAFAVGDSYAASGEPDSDTLRDASSVELRAPSNQGRGNPRQSNKRKMDGQSTRTKQIPERNSAKAGDICPACEQRHEISDCYYVNKAKAPEWFKPNRGIARLVQYKLENDTNLQRTMQEMSLETKRPRFSTTSRSITPHIKTSQTPDAVIE
ncbi:hypothetical protein A1F94_008421 [Pyrenophora tritici-repentis]|nr:hypothetical protein A1F94_008421 [Pyrenophora tritici-repentis]